MNSKNIIIAILAISTIGCGVFGWQQYQRANSLGSEIAKLTKAAKASSERNQRRNSGEPAQPAPDMPPPAAQGPGRGNWQDRGASMRALLESPEAAKLMASQQRGMLDARYAGLFKALNLSPSQLAQLKDLLVEKQNAARDVMSVAREQGLDFRTNRDEIRQLVRQAGADIDASITDIIGQDKFAQYQAYEQTQPQRAIATQLEQRLSYTGEPLTEAQSTQLIALLAENSASSSGRGNRPSSRTFGGASPGVEISNQVIASAQSFLNASQIDALRQMQSEQNDQRQLQQLLMSSGGDNADGSDNAETGARSSRRSRTPRN